MMSKLNTRGLNHSSMELSKTARESTGKSQISSDTSNNNLNNNPIASSYTIKSKHNECIAINAESLKSRSDIQLQLLIKDCTHCTISS